MQNSLFLVFLVLFLVQGCSSPTPKQEVNNMMEDSLFLSSTENNIFQDDFDQDKEIYEQEFPWIKDSTYYQNPRLLIQQLEAFYGQKNTDQTTITSFERHQLYGITDSIWFLNCKSSTEGTLCPFPTLNTQYLFDNNGKLIHKNTAAVAQFVPMMKDSIPLYMSIDHDCNGNGQHHFYMYESGKLIDIFNVLMNDTPKTFDSNPVDGMFQNNYLTLAVQDINQDGHNDIVLKGKWLILENEKNQKYTPTNPFKTENMEYKFLYKPTKEYFLLEK